MSSNIRIEKVCQHCGDTFIAKTTVTKYCGDNCAKRAYKARKRAEKIGTAIKVEREERMQPIKELQAKDFLSVDEASQLIGVSRWTIWRAIKNEKLMSRKAGRRRIIKRSDLEEMLSA